jgi:hypothetical protein
MLTEDAPGGLPTLDHPKISPPWGKVEVPTRRKTKKTKTNRALEPQIVRVAGANTLFGVSSRDEGCRSTKSASTDDSKDINDVSPDRDTRLTNLSTTEHEKLEDYMKTWDEEFQQ